MDCQPLAQTLWIVILTVFMIYLDADSAHLKFLGSSNSTINIYLCTCLVFYIICRLFALEMIFLLISGLIFISLIFSALLHQSKYSYIYYIILAIMGLLSNQRHIGAFMKVFFVILNLVIFMDIVIFVTLKNGKF